MKKNIVLLMLLIFMPVIVVAQFSKVEDTDKTKLYTEHLLGKILSDKTYYEDTISKINEISFNSRPDIAYDICTQARKVNIDEEFLKKLNIIQSVSLIRVLVSNETITSINQIPLKSLNIYDFEEEIEFQQLMQQNIDRLNQRYNESTYDDKKDEVIIVPNEKNPDQTPDVLIVFKSEGESLNYDSYQREMILLQNAITPYEKKRSLLSRIATYALVEKYPLNAEKFTYDYINNFGYDQLSDIMVSYFINKGELNKSASLIDFIINNINSKPDKSKSESEKERNIKTLSALKALVYTKAGNLDIALKLVNDMYEKTDSNQSMEALSKQRSLLTLKLQLYSVSGKSDEYAEQIKKIENERITLDNENSNKIDGILSENGIQLTPSAPLDEYNFSNKRERLTSDSYFPYITVAYITKWI